MTFYVQTTVMQRTDAANLGWQHTQVTQDVQSWFPAVHTQAQSFRSRAGERLQHERHLKYAERWEWIQPYLTTIPTFTRAAHDQLVHSYRMPDGVALDVRRQTMAQVGEIARGVFIDEFDIFKFPGIEALTRSFRMPAGKTLRLWADLETVRRESGIIPVNALVRQVMSAVAAQTQSFRSRARLTLDPRLLKTWDDIGAEAREVIAPPFDEAVWPGIEQLLRSFRSQEGKRLDPRLLKTWDDHGGIVKQGLEPPFDPVNWPALQQLLNSFRMREGLRLDPRLLKFVEPLDWIREPLGLEDVVPSVEIPATGGWLSRREIEYLRNMGMPSPRIAAFAEQVAEGAAILDTSRMRVRPQQLDTAAPLASLERFVRALETENAQLAQDIRRTMDQVWQHRLDADAQAMAILLLMLDDI